MFFPVFFNLTVLYQTYSRKQHLCCGGEVLKFNLKKMKKITTKELLFKITMLL